MFACSQMVKYDNAASHTTYRDTDYRLLQFHFHAPSEHTVDGAAADMELHLVHADANSRLLVVGFMIQADGREEAEEEERKRRGVTASNSALDFLNALLWSHLPTDATSKAQSSSPSASPAPSSSSPLLRHLDSALSSTSTSSPLFYHYPGSLTTPPCTEGVQWFVHSSPLHISSAQLSAYTALFPHTSRPVQPLNGREVAVLGGAAVDEAVSAGTWAVVAFVVLAVVAAALVWCWQRSHSRHTLGGMMDASLQQNADDDKLADLDWRRRKDAKPSAAATAAATAGPHDDDAQPLLNGAGSGVGAVVVPPAASPPGGVMRRSSGGRSASNEFLYGLYKSGEDIRGKAAAAEETKSSPKSSTQGLVRR